MDEIHNTFHPENPNPEGWKKKTALFLSSQSLSLFGSMLVQYAIIWHVTLTTQSGSILTVATIAGFLPQLLISLFAGVWADRYPRKRLIMLSDALTAVSTLALAGFFLMGYRELWLIFLVSAVRSVGAGIQAPAVGALLPQIVPAEQLVKVNGINSTLQPFIMILAPILSGGMLSFSKLETIFFVDVVTAMIAIGLLLVLKVPAHHKAAGEQTTGALEDLKDGLIYIRGNRTIRTLFIFFGFTFFLVVPVAFLTPLLVARSFGEEVWRLTANEVTFFVGSILGGAMMATWGGFKNHFRTIGLACILWGILFAGLGLARDFTLYLAIMFLSGIPMPMFNVPVTTLLQEVTEADKQGRVFGVMGLITNTVMPVGMLIFGPIADVITVETLLVVASGLMILPGMWIFFHKEGISSRAGVVPAEYEAMPGD